VIFLIYIYIFSLFRCSLFIEDATTRRLFELISFFHTPSRISVMPSVRIGITDNAELTFVIAEFYFFYQIKVSLIILNLIVFATPLYHGEDADVLFRVSISMTKQLFVVQIPTQPHTYARSFRTSVLVIWLLAAKARIYVTRHI
jgi:hypothetical protein